VPATATATTTTTATATTTAVRRSLQQKRRHSNSDSNSNSNSSTPLAYRYRGIVSSRPRGNELYSSISYSSINSHERSCFRFCFRCADNSAIIISSNSSKIDN